MMVNWGLNLTEARLAQIRRDGAKLWFQNIGQTRYTDGFLMLKAGAIGRRQWKVNGGGYSNHYNGFTGSGDLALLFPSTEGSLPTVALKCMSEGADDHRYATLLERLVQKAREGGPEAKAAATRAQRAYDEVLAACHVGPRGTVQEDGRIDNFLDFEDKETYDRFRRRIAGHILRLQGLLHQEEVGIRDAND